jgi:hypothetical protein
MLCAGTSVIKEEVVTSQKMVSEQRQNAILTQSISTNDRDYFAIGIVHSRYEIKDLMRVVFRSGSY